MPVLTITVRQEELREEIAKLVESNGGKFPYGEATSRYGLNENTIHRATKDPDWSCTPVTAMRFAVMLGYDAMEFVDIEKDGANERHQQIKLEDL